MTLVNGLKAAFAAFFVSVSSVQAETLTLEQKTQFSNIYSDELNGVYACAKNTALEYGLCSTSLKNDGHAPSVLLPKGTSKGVIVILHGLSDSPFFVRSPGEFLQKKGYVVILPLNSGHGKKDASFDMRDDKLQQRWYAHFDQIIAFAKTFDGPLALGGFSTGGALATRYALNHPEEVNALVLFSGALALSSSAETLSKIWGIKSLAKWIDGDYETMGPHPYKYPSVAGYSALVLMDVIRDVRAQLAEHQDNNVQITLPIFAAHSMADTVTPFEGVESLTEQLKGEHVVFKIDESYDLCHANVPISQVQLIGLQFDKTQVNQSERCALPTYNPLHGQMLMLLDDFLARHMTDTKQ